MVKFTTTATLNHEGYLIPADLPEIESGEVYEITISKVKKRRTLTQNKAVHKYCDMLAEALNDAGLYQNIILKDDFDLEWSMETVKANLWKPIQKVLIDKEKTSEADTGDYNKVYTVLSRNMAFKYGINVPFPSRFGE